VEGHLGMAATSTLSGSARSSMCTLEDKNRSGTLIVGTYLAIFFIRFISIQASKKDMRLPERYDRMT
jgi:hypothetical protein